ncbi:hypothetical protein F4677DRAFT_144070 [Hypoxylon crocopeplum]|nr:hypothetical protein F4677DRAFT_144070 [Hypoxylon crocopeplum]
MPPRKAKTPASRRKKIETKRPALSRRTPGISAAEKRAQSAAERAAKKEAIRDEKLRKHRKEATKIELPPRLDGDLFNIPATQIPSRKRTASMTHDDRHQSKRARIDNKVNRNKTVGPSLRKNKKLSPPKKNKKVERPASPSSPTKSFSDCCPDPAEYMGDFGTLATEIRDQIFGYLLHATHDIRVLRGWSLVYPREKPKLDLAILSTCHVLRLQGLRILYGENTFLYDIRDPYEPLPAANPTLCRIFNNAVIPIDKYGHLIRHVKIKVSQNRMDGRHKETFAKALRKFLPGAGLSEPANIHTLTLQLPAVNQGVLKWAGKPKDPKFVPIAHFVDGPSGVRHILSSLNIQHICVQATDKDGNTFEHTIDLRHHYKQRQMREAREAPAEDSEGAKKYFQRQVVLAQTRIYNLPVRLWQLAMLDDVDEKIWKPLGQMHRPTRHMDDKDVQTLPDDWKDPPAAPMRSPATRSVGMSRAKAALTQQWLNSVPARNTKLLEVGGGMARSG